MMEPQIFTPMGGANQDDSIITPTANAAGRNAFGLGDYKYAANLRIGSSKKDNFGDAELLKDTVEKTTYWGRAVVNNNSDFASGLTGWSQLAVTGGSAWDSLVTFNVPGILTPSAVSNILYQAVSPSGKRMGFQVKMTVNFLMTSSSAQIVFLNGSTILSTQQMFIQNNDGTAVNQQFSKYINAELPAGCNRVGVQCYGYSLIGASITINEFKFFDWAVSSRPVGVEKVIGKREDKENNLLYYCVYNASGNHSIRYYDPATDRIYTVLQWSGLAFAASYFECMAMVDNFMAITDRANRPRLIDVNTVSDLFLILGADFREYHISFHRWAPVMPPIIRGYYDGATNNYKKFQHKVYQWSYRYIYVGRLRSRWSPISNSAQNFESNAGNEITAIELFIPGFTLDAPGAAVEYNYFNNDDLQFYSAVQQIEIGYREGANDLWRTFKRYDVRVAENMVFRYDGEADSTPIPTSDFVQLFDVVPFMAGTVEAIDNRFVFADVLDEEEPAQQVQVTDVGTVKFNSSQTLNNWWNAGSNNAVDNAALFTGCSAGDAHELGLRNYISHQTFKGRGIYKVGIQWLAANGWRSAVYTTDSWIYDIPDEVGIVDQLYALTFKFPSTFRPPSWAVAFQIMRTNCLNIDYFMFGSANAFEPLRDGASPLGNDLTAPDARIADRIRQHVEDARTVTGMTKNLWRTLRGKPLWKSLVSDIRITQTATLANSSRIGINVNNWYNGSIANAGATADNPMNNLYYNFREGDRVRFMGSTVAAPTDAQKVVYDVPILEFTGRVLIIEKPDGIAWVPENLATTDPIDHMIEVYTPRTPNTADYLYYETGEWYPVLYPGTEQRELSKRDWTFTVTTAITANTYGDFKVYHKKPLAYGDCHSIQKTFYYNFKSIDSSRSVVASLPSMDPNPDNMGGSFLKSIPDSDDPQIWEKNNGRPAPAYTELPVVKFKTTQARFGGQIVEESLVNNINRFREEDNKIYPSEYGRIRMLVNTANAQVESVGAILLAIAEMETFSIYVNRNTLEDLSGRTQVTISDRVLGSYNTLLGSHGTLNPESVSVERGRVYFWDAIDGTWVRYGRDGLTEISFYKMRNWYRELGQMMITKYGTAENPVALSEFDPYNEELVTFNNHSTLPSTFRDYSIYKGWLFSEEDRRWKSSHSYEPEMMGRINTQLVMFVAGSLYLTEQGAGYSTFFNSKKDVYIEPVFNDIPHNRKVWQNIAVIATHKWSVERFLSEFRGSKTKQQSRLLLSDFEEVEDGYYAAVKNNLNTVNVNNPIITGDRMRSKAIRALMKLDPAVVTESLLHYVIMHPEDSPKNA